MQFTQGVGHTYVVMVSSCTSRVIDWKSIVISIHCVWAASSKGFCHKHGHCVHCMCCYKPHLTYTLVCDSGVYIMSHEFLLPIRSLLAMCSYWLCHILTEAILQFCSTLIPLPCNVKCLSDKTWEVDSAAGRHSSGSPLLDVSKTKRCFTQQLFEKQNLLYCVQTNQGF